MKVSPLPAFWLFLPCTSAFFHRVVLPMLNCKEQMLTAGIDTNKLKLSPVLAGIYYPHSLIFK